MEGEACIGKNQTGGHTCPHVRAGEIGPRRSGRLLRFRSEITVFRPGNVPLRSLFHGFHRGQALPRGEGGVHQGHKVGAAQPSGGRFLPCPLWGGVEGLGLFRLRGDGPGRPKFLCAGDAPGGAQLLYSSNGKIPLFCGLPYGKVFHGSASSDHVPAPIIGLPSLGRKGVPEAWRGVEG